jgi:hypothetical protein
LYPLPHDGILLALQRLLQTLFASVDLPTPLGADQNHVGGFLEKVEYHQGFEGGAVAAFRPAPIEVAEGLEAADMSGAQPAFQAATGTLLLLLVEEQFDPLDRGGFRPVGQQAMQFKRLGARVQSVEVSHLFDP